MENQTFSFSQHEGTSKCRSTCSFGIMANWNVAHLPVSRLLWCTQCHGVSEPCSAVLHLRELVFSSSILSGSKFYAVKCSKPVYAWTPLASLLDDKTKPFWHGGRGKHSYIAMERGNLHLLASEIHSLLCWLRPLRAAGEEGKETKEIMRRGHGPPEGRASFGKVGSSFS